MGSRIRGLRSSLPAFVPDNENAVIYFLYNLATSLSNGILFGGLTASYLYLETGNSPSKVGYAEGIFGVCMLLPGLIGGYFSDNGRRDRIIRWGGIGTIVGSVAQMLVLVAGDIGSDTVFRRSLEHHVPGIGSVKFTAMCACIILLQSGESIGDASGKALLADSIST
ncbi:Major Facilitator Superfamily (MFS), partial [Diplonema papillatum]